MPTSAAAANGNRDALAGFMKTHFERVSQRRTRRELDFIADFVGKEMVKPWLPAEKLREMLAQLASAAGVELLKAFLMSMAGRL